MALTVSIVMAMAPARAGFDEGMAAYDRGDYGAAAAEWMPLAEGGDAEAQWRLGRLYDAGDGVDQDYAKALRWYRRAAVQGHREAPVDIGILYSDGLGVAKDDATAYMWWEIAKRRGSNVARAMQWLIERNLSSAQIDDAIRRADAWFQE